MITSASFANADGTAVVVTTDDRGAVAISQMDNPVLWAEYQAWGGVTAPYVAPDPVAMDQAALNAALVEPGSVVRALGLVMFAEINKLRVKNGDPAYTLAQFKTALQAQMR